MFCVGFFHLSILVVFFCGVLCGVRSVLGFFFRFVGFLCCFSFSLILFFFQFCCFQCDLIFCFSPLVFLLVWGCVCVLDTVDVRVVNYSNAT